MNQSLHKCLRNASFMQDTALDSRVRLEVTLKWKNTHEKPSYSININKSLPLYSSFKLYSFILWFRKRKNYHPHFHIGKLRLRLENITCLTQGPESLGKSQSHDEEWLVSLLVEHLFCVAAYKKMKQTIATIIKRWRMVDLWVNNLVILAKRFSPAVMAGNSLFEGKQDASNLQPTDLKVKEPCLGETISPIV